jgi:hypothetical protein
MYLVDTNGSVVDAEFSLDMFEGDPCLAIESSGGASPARGVTRRNPDYNRLLGIVLEKLAVSGIQITRIVLDSRKVAAVPIGERVVNIGQDYPVNLAGTDTDAFRKLVQREVALMHRDPKATKGGNAQKRIRICLSRPILSEQLNLHGGDHNSPQESELHAPGLTETEKKYLSTARVGQGQFRQKLLRAYGKVCPVTGILNPELLIASHIKPWKVCNNSERLDSHNGILLSAMVDRLFDSGLISFSERGKMLVSPRLSQHDRGKCGIAGCTAIAFSKESLRYLEYHRGIVFQSA